MYILEKSIKSTILTVGTYETLDRLVDAVQNHADKHGICNLSAHETTDEVMDKTCFSASRIFTDEQNNTVAIEELSELQKEICKRMRGAENDDHMSEEIADAEIVIEKLKIRYGLRERVDEWRRRKLDRLRKKIESRADGTPGSSSPTNGGMTF